MVKLDIYDLNEMVDQITEILSICQCAEDAAAVVDTVPHIETALSVANGMTLALKSKIESMLDDAANNKTEATA